MAESQGQLIGYRAEERVVRITLQRPPLNILNREMLGQLEAALTRAAAEQALAAIVVEGEGRAFCAGVDVADHLPEAVGEMIPLFDRVCQRLAEMPAITVAQIRGSALGGGCELAACCDFAWMARGASIGQPEIQLGVYPPVASLLLPRLVGPRWAARLVLAGETLTAERAAEIGLITEAVAPEALDDAVASFLDRLRGLSAAALREAVRAHRFGVEGWAARLPEVEAIYLEDLMKTEDAGEGLRAFLEKRKPVWRHA